MGINIQSKASRNQLNLPHGTETKPEMQKNGEQPESVVSVGEKERGPMVRRICERGTVGFEQAVLVKRLSGKSISKITALC